ncbi:MAG: site-specific DNA-methyltransferase, partial [Deltaproteobacteria bacterium]|nr:site-specific DNA-methyltransferase [Deltaproteobacteria bacterium]
MTKRKKSTKNIEQYDHPNKKRLNNPPVGLVSENTEPYSTLKKTYKYDPHLDPQLVWAGKAEHTSFEVPTVSLHVHERIDPKTIIDTVQKEETSYKQMSLFESEKMPLREAIEFYKHKEGWSNRMIAGDSLLVMNSLLEKEGMAGKVQMIYIDPPYGIKYGSNFQPFVNKRDVKDRKDEDLTAEPEMIKAFRDTWELGIHSYLTYLRDRLLLARELLHESGSVFVQISDENVHHVRELMDEVFGEENFVRLIFFKTTTGLGQKLLDKCGDYIVWYSKNIIDVKYRALYKPKGNDISGYSKIETPNGLLSIKEWEKDKKEEFSIYKLDRSEKLYALGDLKSQSGDGGTIKIDGEIFETKSGSWKTNQKGIERLVKNGRIEILGKTPRYKRYFNDFPYIHLNNMWEEQLSEQNKDYVVQTSEAVIQRCLLMTTDPGDLVFDPTCGSGTTAYVAEQWGRRWITCDTS